MPDDVPPGSQYVREPENPDSYSTGKVLCQIGTRGGRIELWINRREVSEHLLGRILIKVGAQLTLQHLSRVRLFTYTDDPERTKEVDEHTDSGNRGGD